MRDPLRVDDDALEDSESPTGSPDDRLRSRETAGLVARGGLIRGVGFAFGVIFGVATSAILLRHLGVDDFGRYAAITALFGIVLGITDGGMTTIGTRELSLAKGSRARSELSSALITLRAITALVGSLVAVAFSWIAYGDPLAAGAVLVSISVVFQSAQAMTTVPLLAELRATPVALIDLARQALTLLGVAILAFFGATLLPFFAVQIPITALLLLVTVILVRRRLQVGLSRNWRRISDLIRQTLPMSVAVVLNALYLGAMVVLVSLVASETTTGIYAASARVMEVLVFFASVVLTMAIPALSIAGHEDIERFKAGLQLLLRSALTLAGGLTITLAIAAPLVIAIIGGRQFDASIDVLQVQSFALIGVFASQTLLFALVALRAQRAIIFANAAALLVLIAAGAILVPEFGAVSAALIVVGAEVILAAGLLIGLWRRQRSAFPRLTFVAPLALAMAVAALPMFLPVDVVIQTALGVALFSAAALGLRLIDIDTVRLLLRRQRSAAS